MAEQRSRAPGALADVAAASKQDVPLLRHERGSRGHAISDAPELLTSFGYLQNLWDATPTSEHCRSHAKRAVSGALGANSESVALIEEEQPHEDTSSVLLSRGSSSGDGRLWTRWGARAFAHRHQRDVGPPRGCSSRRAALTRWPGEMPAISPNQQRRCSDGDDSYTRKAALTRWPGETPADSPTRSRVLAPTSIAQHWTYPPGLSRSWPMRLAAAPPRSAAWCARRAVALRSCRRALGSVRAGVELDGSGTDGGVLRP